MSDKVFYFLSALFIFSVCLGFFLLTKSVTLTCGCFISLILIAIRAIKDADSQT